MQKCNHGITVQEFGAEPKCPHCPPQDKQEWDMPKLIIEKAVRATMDFIEHKITREQREARYDECYQAIKDYRENILSQWNESKKRYDEASKEAKRFIDEHEVK